MIARSEGIAMTTRNLNTIIVSGTLSALSAVVFWHHAQTFFTGAQGPRSTMDPVVASTAFIGALIATVLFVKKGSRSLEWAIFFVVLVDVFAALTFSARLLALFWYGSFLAGLPGSHLSNIPILLMGTLFIPMLALTVGNVMTLGMGFVMALPSLLWLWIRHRDPGQDIDREASQS